MSAFPLPAYAEPIVSFIRQYTQANDVPPTLREIAEHGGCSICTARLRVKRLVELGYLMQSNGGAHRNLQVLTTSPRPRITRHLPAEKSLVIPCRREFTRHVRLSYAESGVVLEYGELVQHLFRPVHFESLKFEHYPELLALRDEYGWIWEEVWKLVTIAESADPCESIAVCLMENDTQRTERLLDEAAVIA